VIATKASVHLAFDDHTVLGPTVKKCRAMNEGRKTRVALSNLAGDEISGSSREAESLHEATRSRSAKHRPFEKSYNKHGQIQRCHTQTALYKPKNEVTNRT
jgi:hypothetical protein